MPVPVSGAPADAFTLAQLLDRLAWLGPFWFAGVAFFYARAMAGWIAVERLRRRGVCTVPPGWQARLNELAARMRLTRPVALLESCLTDTPVLIGYLRPVVLLPLGCLTGLSAGQVECILLHELAHIRRHDYLVNLLESVVEGLLFYHPAVWWVSRVVRAERENCCDDRVVEIMGDARAYAATLAVLEERRSLGPQAALAATGGSLIERIRRLTTEPRRAHASAAPAVSAGIMLVLFAAALAAWPEKAPAPHRAHATPPVTGAAMQLAAPKPQDGRLALQAAIEAPYRQAQPLTDAERRAQEKALRQELATPYRKWLNEDVAYIITGEERAAFVRLQTDEERERFIENFWLRRDPTPGTVENEFKEEHYRRIAYANEHFAAGIPGWRTDRGRIYIMYGPPDEIEDRSQAAPPSQVWRYRYIKGVGADVVIEFVDPTGSGEFHMTMDPSEKDALAPVTPPQTYQPKVFTSREGPAVLVVVLGRHGTAGQPGATGAADLGLILDREMANKKIELDALLKDYTPEHPSVRRAQEELRRLEEGRNAIAAGNGTADRAVQVIVAVPLEGSADGFHVFGEVRTPSRRIVQTFEEPVRSSPGQQSVAKAIPLAIGSYRLTVVVKNLATGATQTSDLDFTVD
jgi:GWxTD domain-containing protein